MWISLRDSWGSFLFDIDGYRDCTCTTMLLVGTELWSSLFFTYKRPFMNFFLWVCSRFCRVWCNSTKRLAPSSILLQKIPFSSFYLWCWSVGFVVYTCVPYKFRKPVDFDKLLVSRCVYLIRKSKLKKNQKFVFCI